MAIRQKKILISGAGVAGPALGWWLHHFGFKPSFVEISPQFRAGGYMVDFWGKGFDLVERMGLLPEVERLGYHVNEVRFLNSDNVRIGGFSTEPFWRATNGRFISLPRSDLARIIWRSLPGSIRTRFDDQVVGIEARGDGVRVRFANSGTETFDFVIGAGGLHSKVRALMFGPEDQFETFLGYAFAAFTVAGYEPRTEDVYMTYGVPGRQASRFSMRDDRTMFLFIWRQESSSLPASDEGKRAMLRKRFGGMGWECRAILEALDRARDLYVDTVSQMHLPRWSHGRLALVGDAAWAPSFLAGEGCGLGIIGAYVLAGELARSDGDLAAFTTYEARLRKFIESKQKMASRFGGAFVPKTRFGLAIRNVVASLLDVPGVDRLALSGLKDDIELPDYDAEVAPPLVHSKHAHVA
ncbi:MAG TPA: FAD-binding domain [Sphingomicrobium sp.]|nr:FAD-binding domain [Sphingomicrobium sp.]